MVKYGKCICHNCHKTFDYTLVIKEVQYGIQAYSIRGFEADFAFIGNNDVEVIATCTECKNKNKIQTLLQNI